MATATPPGRRWNAAPYDLLLTDIVMPGLDGIELARRAAEAAPGMKIMFITGFAAVALSRNKPGPEGSQGAVEALPPEGPRRRGRADDGGMSGQARRSGKF